MTNHQPCLTEHQEQCLLIALCDQHRAAYPDAPLLFAIPNAGGYKGGYRSNGGRVARMLKEGVRPGTPDLFLPAARGGFFGFFVEMKTRDGGKVSEAQQKKHRTLERQGYLVGIASGADDAWLMVRNYLDRKYRVGEVNQ